MEAKILEITPEQFRQMGSVEQKDFMLLGLQGKAKFTESKENREE